MNRDHIYVQNAHTNNLKNIDVEIPKHKLVESYCLKAFPKI